jgi:general secretion pathway protein I
LKLLRSTAPEDNASGFTLIEVLVALSIVAVTLTSIGALVATTVRGTRSIEDRLARLETARAIATALPDRDQFTSSRLSGEIAQYHWLVELRPFDLGERQSSPRAPWVPQTVVVTVQSPGGTPIQISTVRLHRRVGE